jgi:hypothetical protein
MNIDWKFTSFYGHPDATKRYESWNLLKTLERLTPHPWVCIGDFNEVVVDSEKLGGNTRQRSHMLAFQQALEEGDLTDLGFVGPKFTWSNCQEGVALIRERLDRGVANRAWRNAFPDAEVCVEASACSDHAPLLLSLMRPRGGGRKHARFFYEAGWASDKNCQEVIKVAWDRTGLHDIGWAQLKSKLAGCVDGLKEWQKQAQNNVQEEIAKLHRKLLTLQAREDISDQSEIKNTKTELHVLLDKEEMWWRQRAKEEWLKFGDRNTRYFYACASAKRRRNHVGSLMDYNGQRVEIPGEIEAMFVEYFSNLFIKGPEGDVGSCQPMERWVTESMNDDLVRDCSMEEIELALFQMGPYKAPGPDGLNASFFQTNWPIMKKEVCNVVMNCLNTGTIPQELNMTHITLIPKSKNPMNVMDFRPISLCNVLYKLISKVLANQLKKILPTIITPTQSAFIPGRLISDNVLAAYETLHTMHTGMWGKKGFMAVKLDMSKAYDRV